jgi:hypothetical protein
MAYIQFGEGIDTVRTIVDLAIAQRLITTTKGKGTHEIKLPNGQLYSMVGKEKLIRALKEPTHGREVLDLLQKMLQWDKADEIHSQVLGMTEEVVDTGEEEEISDTTGVASEGLLELVSSRDSLVEQADVLNMLTRRGKTIYWTNPETGVEYRGQRLELLEGKLGEEGYAAMEKQVLAKIHEIERKLDEQEAATISVPEQDDGVTAGVTGGPTGLGEEFEPEVTGNGPPEEFDAIEGVVEDSSDLIDSVFGNGSSNPQEEAGE